MLRSHEIAIAMSEARERVNVLLAQESRSAEESAEMDTLRGRLVEREREYRAAIASEAAEAVARLRRAPRVLGRSRIVGSLPRSRRPDARRRGPGQRLRV